MKDCFSNSDRNSASLSDIIDDRILQSDRKRSLRSTCAHCSAVQVVAPGMSSNRFENLSVIVRRLFSPSLVSGRLIMKSIVIV